jgi:CHAT domain-containing protein/tetratricopeptide (TPR) repeat protein
MDVSESKRSEDKLIARLANIKSDAARRRFLDRHRSLLHSRIIGRLAPLVVDKVRVDTRQALHLAEAALLIARHLRRKEDLALALRAKGNALHLLGKNRAAVQHHERALKIYESLELWKEAARTLSTSIQPLSLLGEYERALAAAERAREVFVRLGETARIAGLDNNVANVLYRQDRFEEAMAYYQRAYKALLDAQQWEHAGFTLHNIATCCISVNDFPKALDCYQRARDLFVRHELPLPRDQADYNIAYLYYLRGEYSRAIEMLSATRRSCEANGDAYHHALCDLDLSDIYLELNLRDEACEVAHQAFLQFQKLGMRYEAAKALANEAMAYGQQQKTEESLASFAKARSMFEREKNLTWARLLDLYQSILIFHEGRYADARKLCRGAAEFFDGSVLTSKAVLCHLLLARIALQTGDLTRALNETKVAETKLSRLDAPVLRHQSQLLLGQIARKQGERAAALAAYGEARQALETLRTRLQSEELKISFVKNRMEVYEGLVELYLDADNAEMSVGDVFSCIEAAKSRSMIEMMQHTRCGIDPLVPARREFAGRIRELRDELNWYYRRLEVEQFRREGTPRKRIEQLQERARAREAELSRTMRELAPRVGEAEALIGHSDFRLAELQRALPAAAALIEYYAAGDRLLAVLVTCEHAEVSSLCLMPRVTRLLQLLRFQFSKFHLGTEYVEQFQQSLLRATLSHLQQLYNALISPLRIPETVRHVIFVPHGPLHFLPFHALHSGEAYLCDRYDVSYAPSAALLTLCQQKSISTNQTAVVMGVPDQRAPLILKEVKSVAALLPEAELFVGKQASMKVLRDRGPQTGILHIATHGEYRQDNPMFSSIKLGDGHLNLYDLYDIRLASRLVTLSGCATGMNFVAEGDELLGLQRGLFAAGATSLLLSLWDVHDHSTAGLMETYYEGFVRSGDMAGSLRSAMLRVRAERPHPYFWAPFVLVGKVCCPTHE